MYFEETSSFINLKDIDNMFVNTDDNIYIRYHSGNITTIKIGDNKVAFTLLKKISKEAERVQTNVCKCNVNG